MEKTTTWLYSPFSEVEHFQNFLSKKHETPLGFTSSAGSGF
jgi:hypothetical protein